MEKKLKLLGIIVLLIAITFTIICCAEESNNDNNEDDNSNNNNNGNAETPNPQTPDGNEASLYAKAPPVSALDTPVNLSGLRGATVIDRAVYYVNANPGTYTLLLNNDIEVGKYNADYNFNEEWSRRLYQPNINLIIIGNGSERKIKNTSPEDLFQVGNNSATAINIKLTLGNNVTLLGSVVVTEGATLVMQDNAGITGGEGVYVSYGLSKLGATFIMQDNASVYGNVRSDGGGVWVEENCTFTMRDNASVSVNRATEHYGGGVWIRGGTFNMYGGTISGNSAPIGGGVCISGKGIFNMYGGTVYGDDASSTLANTGYGAALSLSTSVSANPIAKYGDGSNILPHTDGINYHTNNTITGK